MNSKLKKKLNLGRETVRTLSGLSSGQLGGVVGGISGLRGCHSIRDHCDTGTGGVLCGASVDDACPSGDGGNCQSAESICN
jgi:hypothetical protein